MTGFGWNYPPGVTGMEPEIVGFPEDGAAEWGRDGVFQAAENIAYRRGLARLESRHYASEVLIFLDLAEDGPEEDEVFHVAYIAGRRKGFGPAGAEQDALEITNQVMSEWAVYLDILSRNTVIGSGPDSDQLYEEQRERKMGWL